MFVFALCLTSLFASAQTENTEPVPVITPVSEAVFNSTAITDIASKVAEQPETFVWFKWFPYVIFFLAIFLVFRFKDRFSDGKGTSMKKTLGFLFGCTYLSTCIYVCVATRSIHQYFYISTMTVMLCYFGKDIIEFLKAWKAKI
jgi:hypothetical protein